MQGTWIPVTEKLPEFNKPVLIYANGKIDVAECFRERGSEKIWWRACWVDGYEYEIEWSGVPPSEVSHWQEVPEVPE